MTADTIKKMNNIFSPDFVNQNSDIASVEELFERVAAIDSSISKSDFEEYISQVSKKMHNEGEIYEETLDDVSGGFGWATAIAIAGGIDAATKLISWSYKSGKAVGEAIYNWTH